MPKPVKTPNASTPVCVNESPCAKAGCENTASVNVIGRSVKGGLDVCGTYAVKPAALNIVKQLVRGKHPVRKVNEARHQAVVQIGFLMLAYGHY